MHIAFVRRDVEITTQQHRRLRIVVARKEIAQTLHPRELERILLRSNCLPVRNVNVDDLDAVDVGRDQSRLRGLIVIRITTISRVARTTREYRDAVVRCLSEELALVT